MTWIYRGEEFTEPDVKDTGFVYMITNKATGRRYIGKKLFWFTKSKVVKGKRKRTKVPSDWKEYWSSSDELREDVNALGEENFIREILHICGNKGLCNYLEAKEQFVREVLEHPDDWYNGQIQVRVHRTHVNK
jgi:hypothetical protein